MHQTAPAVNRCVRRQCDRGHTDIPPKMWRRQSTADLLTKYTYHSKRRVCERERKFLLKLLLFLTQGRSKRSFYFPLLLVRKFKLRICRKKKNLWIAMWGKRSPTNSISRDSLSGYESKFSLLEYALGFNSLRNH